MEQGLFAGTHFLINIMLARWLPLDEYGKFATAYSITVLMNALHTSFVSEPMAIIWAKNLNRRQKFLEEVQLLNITLSLCFMAVSLLSSAILLILNLTSFYTVLLSAFLALALPLFWFVRQAAFADMRPWAAAGYTGFYAIGFAAGCVALKHAGLLDVTRILLIMGFAATLAALTGLPHYGARLVSASGSSAKRVFRQAWNYGRWAVPTGALIWFTNNAYYLLLPYLSSAEEAGRLKMTLNLLMPLQQIYLGIALIALPMMARAQSRDKNRINMLSKIYLSGAVVGGVIFCTLILFVGDDIFTLIYGSHRAPDAALLSYGLALPLLWSVIATSRTILKARGAVENVFNAYLCGLGIIGIFAVPIGAMEGARGALLGISSINFGIAMFLIYGLTAMKYRSFDSSDKSA